MKTYNKVLICLWLVTLLFFFCGCGAKLENETVYRVEGDATIHVVVGVDVTACEGLNPEDKAECIQNMTKIAEIIAAQQSASESLPSIP